jgi:DNA-binding LacI/PurR family transcriptional regulator
MPHPYQMVADDILLRIRRGEWKNGERLPAVRDLETLYPHSRMTLHKALRHLQASGYITIVNGRGAYVKVAHIKDPVGILMGGVTPAHIIAPFAMTCVDFARAYFARLGLEPRIYSEDPLAPTWMPQALLDDLDAGKLKGLLTVQSRFSFKHLDTDAWRRHRVPHVDIGSQPAPQRVYIDFEAFMVRALEVAREAGRSRPLLIPTGSAMSAEYLRSRFGASGADVYVPPPELGPPIGAEEFGFRLMQSLIRRRATVDAIVAADDVIAKGIVQGALAGRIDIPRQVMVLALVNRGIELFYPAPVTRLEVDVEALAIHAGDRLARLMREPDLPPETVLFPPNREIRTPEPSDRQPEGAFR